MSVKPDKLSPNQAAKRRELVTAAQSVLLSEGLDRFSTRVLAEHLSSSRGAIHYYFDSVDEIVAAAMEDLLEAFAGVLEEAAAAHDQPVDQFWAVVDAYYAYFAQQPAVTLLWFDWVIRETQAGRPAPAVTVEGRMQHILEELLVANGVDEPAVRADGLVAYMFGAILRDVFHPDASAENVHRHIALLSGLPG